MAAVELLNVLRPFVAIGRFITFAALALYRYPEWQARFAAGDAADIPAFMQEVRRFYPFFPLVGGRAVRPVDWHGHSFATGDRVLFDLYGTNHDPQLWPQPQAFRPERFAGWTGDAFALIPQCGGTFETGHRCPGEWLTIAIIEEAVRLLAQEIRYAVPMQDLSVSLGWLPALPQSGFVMRDVRRR